MPRHRATFVTPSSGHRGSGVYSSTKRLRQDLTVSFFDEDMEGIQYLHEDAVTITARICGFRVENMMVDIGSSADVLFNWAYEKMAPKISKKLRPYDHDLFGFNGQPVKVRSIISLPVELGDGKHTATRELEFLVVDSDSPYTAILGRPALSAFGMMVSQYHLKVKFMTPAGVGL